MFSLTHSLIQTRLENKNFLLVQPPFAKTCTLCSEPQIWLPGKARIIRFPFFHLPVYGNISQYLPIKMCLSRYVSTELNLQLTLLIIYLKPRAMVLKMWSEGPQALSGL